MREFHRLYIYLVSLSLREFCRSLSSTLVILIAGCAKLPSFTPLYFIMLLRTMARFILSLFFFLSFTTALPADASENPTRRHNGRDDRDDRTSRYDGDATGYQSKIYFTNW